MQSITYLPAYLLSLFVVCDKVLATRMMEESKTADNIRTVVTSILQEFKASRPNNFYVTDNGANNVCRADRSGQR